MPGRVCAYPRNGLDHRCFCSPRPPSCSVATGFSKDEASLYRYRCVELKHGRVAMLAILGQLIQLNTHLPDAVFSNPRPLGALNQLLAERPLAIVQIVLAIAALELTAGAQDVENNAPGQIGRYVHIFHASLPHIIL